MAKVLVTITGPTCSGKTTLQNMLQKEGLSGIVSFTTRKPRQGEVEGQDYYFLDKIVDKEETIESTIINGNQYGILKKEISRVFALDKNIVVVVDPIGARQIDLFSWENNIHHIAVYLENPPLVIYSRFLERFYKDDKAVLEVYATRLNNLTNEIQNWKNLFTYDLMFKSFNPENQETVVNQILDKIDRV